MLYNKDNQYTLKYVTKDGKEKELDYTPEKDMSVPEIITMLKNKDKDFFKLLKESKFDKVSKKIFNKGKQDGMTKDDADAIAASIGRKKYGKEKFQKMAQKGKKTEDIEKDKVRFDGGELNVIKDNLTLSEFNDYIQNIENTFSGAITFVSNPENVPLYNDLQRVEVYSDDTNEPSKFVYYTEDYDVVNDETTYTIYGDGDLEESKITTTSGEYDTEEYEKKRSNVKQAFKDFWNNKISGKDLEDIKRQSKLSQGELDSIQYDASREVDNKMEAKNKDVKGIFDKKDVKSYLQDIGRVVANTIQQTAKNVNIEIPTSGTLMSNNTVIQYVLPVSRFTGDLIGLGEEIGKNLKAVLESGRVKDVKCVPEHRKNKQVLILSIIGPNIAKVIGESVDKELKHPELNNNIKDFYTSSFSGDDLGDNINNSVTFLQLYRALKNKKDIYKLLGTGDSTVRERVFRELARILNTDYMYVYNIWQYGVVDGQPNVIKEDKEKIGKVMNKMKKVEAENNNGTLSIDLNTGVLPIVDVDMYSMSDMINDFDVTQKELDDIVMETAPEYIEDTLSEILSGVSVIAKSVYHPSQYNYSGDELEFTLNCDKGGYESLKERTLQNESFSKFLKDNYSSHSGFISSMADNLDDFETQEEWKQVVQVIMFNVPQKTLEYNKDAYNDKFMDILSSNYPMIDDEDYDDYVNEDLEESKKMIKENNATEIDENKKIVEDDEVETIDNDSKGEDMTETQENMEQAVQELGDIDSETEFGIDTIASTIDVLITDEQSAIDGYNSFLGQCKNTLPDELYNTIKTEIDEIIQDEEDHINKLTVIKETLNTDTAPSENTDFEVDMEDVDTVEENKQLNENSSYNFKYKKGDTVPFKGKNYKVVKVIPAHQWEGQNASDEEGEDNSFVEFTDDMYEIQNPKNSSDWGYVKATELDK